MDEKDRVERWRNSGNHRLFVHKKLIRTEDITDTDRLEFMMQFFCIDDLESDDCSLSRGGRKNHDLRRVIDKAIAASKEAEE